MTTSEKYYKSFYTPDNVRVYPLTLENINALLQHAFFVGVDAAKTSSSNQEIIKDTMLKVVEHTLNKASE